MAVSSATVRQPRASPMPIMVSASRRESLGSVRNAPLPTLMSSTSPVRSSASFFDMMLAAMSGMDSTVPVTSRSAYSLRSAGTRCRVCPIMTQPSLSTWVRASCRERSVRNPVIASSLSRVPPVCPRPRPEIIGTASPRHAAMGARRSEVLSPTPPIECLSTRGLAYPVKSSRSPDVNIASTSAFSSSGSRPRKKTAIASADIW